jgi:hypothetical protein
MIQIRAGAALSILSVAETTMQAARVGLLASQMAFKYY